MNPPAVEAGAKRYWERAQGASRSSRIRLARILLFVDFPYPSGPLHMGHVRNYTIGDVVTRFNAHERQERAANRWAGTHSDCRRKNAGWRTECRRRNGPSDNIATHEGAVQGAGLPQSIGSAKVTTCRPDYYRWNQWLFLRMLEKGIAYLKTGVVKLGSRGQNGARQRAGHRRPRPGAPVRCRAARDSDVLPKITRLRRGSASTRWRTCRGWPDRVRAMQSNWIGKSEGVGASDSRTEIDGEAGVMARVHDTRGPR